MEEAPKVKRRIVGKQDVRTPEEKRIATIEKVYYNNETGYQNLRETWKAAEVLDNSITENDVKKWKATLEAQEASIWLQLVHPIKAIRAVPDRPVVFHQGRRTRTKGRGQEAR